MRITLDDSHQRPLLRTRSDHRERVPEIDHYVRRGGDHEVPQGLHVGANKPLIEHTHQRASLIHVPHISAAWGRLERQRRNEFSKESKKTAMPLLPPSGCQEGNETT